jgi:hypothetical protein
MLMRVPDALPEARCTTKPLLLAARSPGDAADAGSHAFEAAAGSARA